MKTKQATPRNLETGAATLLPYLRHLARGSQDGEKQPNWIPLRESELKETSKTRRLSLLGVHRVRERGRGEESCSGAVDEEGGEDDHPEEEDVEVKRGLETGAGRDALRVLQETFDPAHEKKKQARKQSERILDMSTKFKCQQQ